MRARGALIGMLMALGLLAAGCAPELAVPPRLIAVWPSAGATLPVAPHTFELIFNRSLRPEDTWATVWPDEDGALLGADASVTADDPHRLRLRIQVPIAGRYRLRWRAVAARTGGAQEGEQAFSMRGEAMEVPKLDISRRTAETGDRVELVGSGFGQDCPVRLSIGDDDQPMSTVRTDAKGGFVAEAWVPPAVPFGMQPVSAVDTCGESATTALQVRWGGWPPLVAFTVGQPGPRAGEVTFSLSMRNRSDYVLERVRVVMGDPPGASFINSEPLAQRLDRAIAWDLPMVDRGVLGPFRATFRVSGGAATHARIEFRHRRPRGCGDNCLPAFVSDTTSDSPPVFPAD